jgi:hypothetical protein
MYRVDPYAPSGRFWQIPQKKQKNIVRALPFKCQKSKTPSIEGVFAEKVEIRMSSLEWGQEPNKKNACFCRRFLAERAGFECHPLNGGQEPGKKNACFCRRFLAERAGFEPAIPCSIHAFQACALSQTTRPLQNAHVSIRAGSIIPSLVC